MKGAAGREEGDDGWLGKRLESGRSVGERAEAPVHALVLGGSEREDRRQQRCSRGSMAGAPESRRTLSSWKPHDFSFFFKSSGESTISSQEEQEEVAAAKHERWG